jgi:hypothetical protein
MYFSKSPVYSSLPSNAVGTNSLVVLLTKVLSESIVRFLPELLSQIKEKKSKLHEMYIFILI